MEKVHKKQNSTIRDEESEIVLLATEKIDCEL